MTSGQTLGLLRRMLITGCAIAGLVLVAPYAWIWATHRVVSGSILEVFPTPLPDGRVRSTILFEFAFSDAHGVHELLGYRIGDRWGRPRDELDLDPGAASALSLAWRPTETRRRTGRVFFTANDPAGSAFIIPAGATMVRWQLLGSALVLVALGLSLPVRRR